MPIEKQLTKKQNLILLGVLKENKDGVDIPTIHEKYANDMHINSVRKSLFVFEKIGLIELENVGSQKRPFYRISPRRDIDTFKKIAKIFLHNDYCIDYFMNVDYTQKMINQELVKDIEENWDFKFTLDKNVREFDEKNINTFYEEKISEQDEESFLSRDEVEIILKSSPTALKLFLFPRKRHIELIKSHKTSSEFINFRVGLLIKGLFLFGLILDSHLYSPIGRTRFFYDLKMGFAREGENKKFKRFKRKVGIEFGECNYDERIYPS